MKAIQTASDGDRGAPEDGDVRRAFGREAGDREDQRPAEQAAERLELAPLPAAPPLDQQAETDVDHQHEGDEAPEEEDFDDVGVHGWRRV